MRIVTQFRGPGASFAALGAVVTLALATACGGAGAAGTGTAAPTTESKSETQTNSQTDSKTNSQPDNKTAAPKVAEPANARALATLKGDIVADGSSTVHPITAAAAEEFRQYARDVRISVGISGTGGGFKRFCAGESDISNASRPIRPTEVEECQKATLEFIELPVAYDGLAVVVHPRNTWVDYLTVDELKTIWEPEAQGKVTNWKQVRDSFPDRPLTLCGPGTDSGTFDYFTEAINGKEKASRGDYQASEDDNVLVTCVGGDEGALGYFGYAYVVENEGKVKAVPVQSKDGPAIAPSVETVRNGSYQPLSRPLFIYVKQAAASRPEVQEFINFYLSDSFIPLIPTREVGYVPLPDNIYAAVRQRFAEGKTGTLFPKGAEVGATLDRYLQ